MARYDKDTNDFMSKVAADGPAPPVPSPAEGTKRDPEDLARLGLATARGFLNKTPLAVAARIGTAVAADKVFEKQSGLSPIKIYRTLNDSYGREWFDWEPETLWKSLEDDLGAIADEEVRNVVMSLQVIVNTNQAHEHWNIFENVGQAFNLNDVDFSTVQPLELNEIAYALRVISTIRPKEPYDPEVQAYIAASAKNSGVVYLPTSLFTVGPQTFLEDMNNDTELRSEVQIRWPKGPKEDDSVALKIQLLRLEEIRDYAKGASSA